MNSNAANKRVFFEFHSVLIFAFAVCSFLSLSPFYIWGTGLYKFFVLFLSFIFIFYFFGSKIALSNILLPLSFCILVFTLNFSSGGFEFFNSSMIVMFLFLFIDDELKLDVYRVFRVAYAIVLFPGLIVLFLTMSGFDPTWSTLDPISDTRAAQGVFYRNYLVSIALSTEISSTAFGEMYRFSSVFDEPGVVGTISALFLISNRFNMQGYSSKIIFVSGLLSFSLAFYILIAVYLISSKPAVLLKVGLPCVLFFAFFYPVLKHNDLVNRFLYERLENLFTDPSSINNRIDPCFSSIFSDFIFTDNVFLGNGAWAHTQLGCDVSSYLSVIYNHGVLGFIFIVFFYSAVILLLSRFLIFSHPFFYLPFLMVFSMSLYQRPDFITVFMLVIYSGSILNINKFIFQKQTKNNLLVRG